jgi:hypothetical protein
MQYANKHTKNYHTNYEPRISSIYNLLLFVFSFYCRVSPNISILVNQGNADLFNLQISHPSMIGG